jgi:anti-anti-sigma factor
MDLREEALGEVTVLAVKERIDSTTAPVLGDRLVELVARRRVVLDLSGVEYVSSAGFRIFLLAAKQADEAGSQLVFCALTNKVRQLFELGGFLDLFRIIDSRQDGIAAVS